MSRGRLWDLGRLHLPNDQLMELAEAATTRMSSPPAIDSSVLINYLKLGRTELLAEFGLAPTTHVEAEITADSPDQVGTSRFATF